MCTVIKHGKVEKMTIKALAKTDKAEKIIKIDSNDPGGAFAADVMHTVKPSEDSDLRYNLKWRLDFDEVIDEEIFMLATRSVVIMLQSKWRKDKERMVEKKWHNVTFKVRDILDAKRAAADPVSKAANLANKMTKAEREALTELLEKM